MADLDQLLQNEKLIIRSLLMTAPRGFTLSDFCKEYKNFNGQPVPYAKFGFSSPLLFLQNMPDVVNISKNDRLQDYVLTGVANDQTAHIEKLVSKQKVSKQNKLPVGKRRVRAPLRLRAVPSARIPAPVRTPPPIRTQPRFVTPAPTSNFVKLLPSKYPTASRTQAHISSFKAHLPPTVKLDIIKLLKRCGKLTSLADFRADFWETYDKELNWRNYGFNNLQECLATVKEIEHTIVDGCDYLRLSGENNVRPSERQPLLPLPQPLLQLPQPLLPLPQPLLPLPQPLLQLPQPLLPLPQPLKTELPAPDVISTHSTGTFYSCVSRQSHLEIAHDYIAPPILPPTSAQVKDYKTREIFTAENKNIPSSTLKISDAMKVEFKQVLELNPHGIWATDFPSSYEAIIGNPFDLDEQGFSSLDELFNSLPDIFRYRPPDKCHCDYLLFGAKLTEQQYSLQFQKDDSIENNNIDDISKAICNIREMLQGSPEGVYLTQFADVYNDSFEDSFLLSEFGFDNLEKFLLCIADHVPLKINYLNARKNVKLGREITPALVHTKITCWKTSLQKKIPEQIVTPGMKYMNQAVPSDQSIYSPVNILKIADPSLLWIQLMGAETSEALDVLIDEMDDFYIGPYGDLYFMQDQDIVPGLVCAAVWPGDGSWQRASIIDVPSNGDYVMTLFIDQGAVKKVLKSNMKYLRKEFLQLPAQAMKAKLAFIKPKNGNQWDSHIHERLSSFCNGKILEAKFIKTPLASDSCAIWLQDSSGLESICLNEALVTAGLANYSGQYVMNNPFPSTGGETLQDSYVNVEEIAGLSEADLKQAMSTILKIGAAMSVANNEQLLDKILHLLDISDWHGSPTDLASVRVLLSSGLNSSVMSQLFNTESKFTGQKEGETGYCLDRQASESGSNNSSPYKPAMEPIAASSPNDQTNSYQYNGISPSWVDGTGQSNGSDSTGAPSSPANYDTDVSSDIFQNDEDEYLDELCARYANATPKYVQRVNLRDRHRIHIIVVDKNPFVSSGDISILLWPCAKYDYLPERLKEGQMNSQRILISECDYPELFDQAKCYKVKGINTRQTYATIALYPLKSVVGILNMFGHPSSTIRNEIFEEIRNFDPEDELWDCFSNPDWDELDEDETPADDFYKLSVYDLRLMVDNLLLRRQALLQEMTIAPSLEASNMIRKVIDHIQALEKRVKEIEKLSTSFFFSVNAGAY